MAGAPITTLFTEVSAPGQGPSGVAVSFLIHCILIGGSFYTIRHTPRIQEPNLIDEVPVRLLTLNRPVNVYRDFGVFSHPAPRKTTPAPKPQATGGGQKVPTVRPRLELRIEHAPQTLVDPLRKPEVVVKIPTPLPNVVLWKPEPIMVKEVQPALEVPTTAPVKSSMTPPNHEPDLADVQVASTPNATEKPALAPSTTSPVTSLRPAPIQQAPQTSSVAEKPPAPAALVSITEFRMEKGTTALPPANQVASSKEPVSTQPGKVALGAAEPSRNQTAPKDGIGTGKQPGEHGDQTGKGTATAAPAVVAAVAAPATVAPAKVPAPATDSGSAINNPQTRVATKSATNDKTIPADDVENGVHVSLPPDGRYGAIVVGGSLSDMFPETDGIMTDRLTYTV